MARTLNRLTDTFVRTTGKEAGTMTAAAST